MHFSKVPTLLIIYFIAYSLSPIVAFFGGMRMLGPFYNLFCSRKYKTRTLLLSPEKEFKLIIPLLYLRIKNAQIIFNLLVK